MPETSDTRVCIVYAADPLGDTPGGIDSVIRGILHNAPRDLRMSVVGATTDPTERPVQRWTECSISGRAFDFYPVIAVRNSTRQARVPVTLRFILALGLRKPDIAADVLEFHRIEPCLAFLNDARPRTLVMHQNMDVIRDAASDIRWKYWPGLYFKLEDYLLPKLESVYCVREDAAMSYRKRYPLLADRFSFTPTWVDTNLFRQPETGERRQRRREFLDDFGLPRDCFTLVTVGRLDKQKNPLLLVEAFAKLHARMPDIGLVFVGEGVLRGRIEDRVRQLGLEAVVKLAGAKPPMKVAEYLQGADLFVLSSGYEGMPISVLEALASGLPVTSTAVGEVPRAVHPGVNGELVSGHDADSLAGAIEKCRENAGRYRGDPAVRSIQDFTPGKVLQPIYENYRRLAKAVREPSSDNSRP